MIWDTGVRTSPATHGDWGRQTPWQSSSDDYQEPTAAALVRTRQRLPAGRRRPASGYAGYGQQDEQTAATAQQPQQDQYGQLPASTTATSRQAAPRATGARPATARAGTAGGYGGQPEYGQGDYGYERGAGPAATPRAATASSRARIRPGRGYQDAPADTGPGRRRLPGQPTAATRTRPRLRPVRRVPGAAAGHRAATRPCRRARAATRPRTRGTTGTAASPPPRAAASFADTGTYRLNGRVIDEYGTGPRGALRDPVARLPARPAAGRRPAGPRP